MENIGIFSTHTLWPTHFETDLEILQNEIANGNNAYVFRCNKNISNCELIWHWSVEQKKEIEELRSEICNKCIAKQNKGFSIIDGNFNSKFLISEKQLKSEYNLDDYFLEDREKLKELVIDNSYLVGWSILSSLISNYRNPFIQVSEHEKEIRRLFQDCNRIYYSTLEFIEEYKLRSVYVFNGRLSYTKAVIEAALKMNIDCYVHERGAHFTKYSIFKNHTFHNISKLTECIYQAWNNEKNLDLKTKLGQQFYIDRENNIIGSWSSFLDNQNPDSLPDNWNSEKQNIALFTSSEDEFMSISKEWDNPYFKTQIDGIYYIANLFANRSDYHLYIRVHPNTKGLNENYKKALNKVSEFKNTTLINYDSNVSTYKLLKNCPKVISFGSSTGIEAVFNKKISIVLGNTLYSKLKGFYMPKDVSEIESLIFANNLELPVDDDSIKFGYYMKTFGIEFKHYVPVDYKSGKFKGVDLNIINNQSHEVEVTLMQRIKNKIKSKLK